MLRVTAFVALLRAVNVSGTGKLPMSELKAIGEACGFGNVRTFIASGNLLFDSAEKEAEVRHAVEQRVERFFGKPVPVLVRSGAEMAATATQSPFTDEQPSHVMAHFIDEEPVPAMLEAATGVNGERMALGPRAIYVAYGAGIGRTRLKLPAGAAGTARNMNSIAKIAGLLA